MIDYTQLYDGLADDVEAKAAGANDQQSAGKSQRPAKYPGQRQQFTKHAAAEKFQALHTFCVASMRHLPSTAASVWVILWDWSNDLVASLDQDRIAEQLGAKPITAKRAIRALEAGGYITVLLRGGEKVGPSVYRLHPVSKHGDKATEAA